MNKWHYNNQEIEEIPDETTIGFVYIITNVTTGKKYIGKKNFYQAVTRQKTVLVKQTGLKKKKKIRSQKESDWKTYFGSSVALQDDVKNLGEENFHRNILRLCYTKGELSYFEAYHQMINEVLLKPDEFYNEWIMLKCHRTHLKNLKSK